VLDEMHLRIARVVEMGRRPEVIIAFDRIHLIGSAEHGLEQQQVARDMFVDEVDRQQGMSQMIKHAHEDHEIELFAKLPDIVGRHLAEFDLETGDFGCKFRLRQVFIVGIKAEHALRTPALHFHGVEAGIAADVENGLALQIIRDDAGETAPLDLRVVPQEVRRRGTDTLQIEIVKPGAERIDTATDFFPGENIGHEVPPVVAGEDLSILTRTNGAAAGRSSGGQIAHLKAMPWRFDSH